MKLGHERTCKKVINFVGKGEKLLRIIVLARAAKIAVPNYLKSVIIGFKHLKKIVLALWQITGLRHKEMKQIQKFTKIFATKVN